MKKIRIGMIILLFCLMSIWQTKIVRAALTTGTCGDNITYNYDDNTKTLTLSGSGNMYDYYWLNDSLIYGGSVENVIIEDGITTISNHLFAEFYSLKSVTIPNSIISIGDGAFDICRSLKSVTIPDSVKNIGKYAFRSCKSLKSIKIGNNVTSIDNDTFVDCQSLTNVTIPNSVTSIGDNAFFGCKSLKSVKIGNKVTNIGDEAFADCYSLTSVTLPNSVKSIGFSSFYFCYSLTSITIPNSVKSIGDGAFANCYKLTKATFKNKKTSIKKGSFGYDYYGTKVGNVTNPNVIIYGYKNSTAQKFANKYKLGFQTIGQKQATKTSMTRLSSSKSGAQVQAKWKKLSKAYQYEIQLYDKADKYGYSKFVRVITKKTSLKLKKNKDLKKGKTYYVRVRAYAKRSGKQIISPWSTVKKLKMKK